MIVRYPGQLPQGRAEARRLVACGAKAKKTSSKPAGKGFGSPATTATAPQRRRGVEIQLLDDLPPIALSPESDINGETRDTCLFFMNKTEELCGRLPKFLDHAWAQATAQRVDDCVSRPLALTSPNHTASLHILDLTHDDFINSSLVAAVWGRVKPDAVALDVPPPYTKSFTRMAKAMDPQLLAKLLATPLTSLSGALNHGDDLDRLRWHHTLLHVVSQGASPIAIDEAALVNVFANRDLHLSECVTAAHLAAGTAPLGTGAVPLHGIDVEDEAMMSALDADEFWSEQDVAAYRSRLLGAVDPQLRAAVNTWLQGIPSGTSSTLPRQRFIIGRLEQALNRQQAEAFQAGDAAWRSSHPEARVREQQQLRQDQSAHLLGRLRDIAAGRLGGRKAERVLAVVGGGHALRIRALAAQEERREAGAARGAPAP